jgi:DNA (cytosine-5)-methyltransferase 1
MRHGSLFSGIGGFDLAAEWMGWENVFHCEWMEFPRKVLDYYFPNADSHIDICKTDFKKYEGTIDIISGGFPCQPFSTAGKRKGTDDERYLWGEMLRAVQEIKPKYVIAENVFGITNIDGGMVFEQVCLDLENEGYEVQPFIIPSASKNAPHRRDRCWFIGVRNATDSDLQRLKVKRELAIRGKEKQFKWSVCKGNATNTLHKGLQRGPEINGREKYNAERRGNGVNIGADGKNISGKIRRDFQKFPTQSPICGGDDGLPTKLDGISFSKWRAESIKGYGNAIVPQVAYELFKIISKL